MYKEQTLRPARDGNGVKRNDSRSRSDPRSGECRDGGRLSSRGRSHNYGGCVPVQDEQMGSPGVEDI